MTCENCGAELEVGDYPFCPHGRSKPRVDGLSSYVQDEIPGGMVLNNTGPVPVTVGSYTEMNQLFESKKLTRLEKYVPTPGTNKDPSGVVDSRKYMDPTTLQNGAALILRHAKVQAEADAFTDKLYVNRESRVLTDAEAVERREQIADHRRWRRGA